MSLLSESIAMFSARLNSIRLDDEGALTAIAMAHSERRGLPLDDLTPAEQAKLIASRIHTVQPNATELADRMQRAADAGRPFVAKLGIDPTGAEVHLGHAVPMLILSRIQRMGHRVVFIVGDVTAKIGDPSGRSDERPPLTDEQIAKNLETYQQQVAPFFDFEHAEFRYNGDWLRSVTLPRIIEIASAIPVSMPLQREDFRKRLDAGQGLSLAEVLYSVVMALDSVEIECDAELGGLDQLLNMQMCRKVMSIEGQEPEVVLATDLVEGTDGSGAKMSKSRGNYVPVSGSAEEMFGRVMSIPDRLVPVYFRAFTELTDDEIALLQLRVESGDIHPMDAKRLLASLIVSTIHDVPSSTAARAAFTAKFSNRTYAELDLPTVTLDGSKLADVLIGAGFAESNGQVRRLAKQSAIRIVTELDGDQDEHVLPEATVFEPLAVLVGGSATKGTKYLKVGRRIARIAE